MSIALYLDENVPRAVALGLRLRGVEVITVQDDDRIGIDDRLLLDRATELRRPPLLAEARLRQKSGTYFSGVIYAPQPRVTIGICVRDLHLIAEVMNADELENQVEFIPL